MIALFDLQEEILSRITYGVLDQVDYKVIFPVIIDISKYGKEGVDIVTKFIPKMGFKVNFDYGIMSSMMIGYDSDISGITEARIRYDYSMVMEPYACRFCIGKEKLTVEKSYDAIRMNLEYRLKRICCQCGRDLVVAEMIKIIGPYIMVEPVARDVKTKAGLVIPATFWRVWRIGKVVRLGEHEKYFSAKGGYRNSYVQDVPTEVKGKCYHRPDVDIGDIVLFQNTAVRSIKPGCNEYFLLHYDDVDLKVESMDSVTPI